MKRKMYAKRETKWHKRTRQNKKTLLLYALVGVSCIINLQGAYDTYKARQELIEINKRQTIYTTRQDVIEVSMREYVLDQVEKNGFDRYKVYDLIMCESRWNDQEWNVNWHEKEQTYTIDRGLWEINSYHHSEVSASCAYDYKCATKEAIRILKERGYKEWACGKILGLN